jgi:hypothetical protein
MRVAETLEVELIGASAGGTLHRHEVGQRADRRLDAIDALDIRAAQHVVERRGQKLFGQDVDEVA